ncbi:hypothetical protein [Limnobaculum parvum]|uniref:Uncharacterized protein n=1 Tax=Limnobaculum parvum TaxID=2172103 RepID=A0A2Y9U0C5_9GAMM|nr:hypothetical protein [Limnobaculum parvum]AWH89385.1 hypothetical protein HYN51_12995 [Limnobaculum parvum]
MAVLIEGISVVIRCEQIVKAYYGGVNAFASEVPNGSLRADGKLACVTFMTPDDVQKYVSHLEQRGLVYLNSKAAIDLVVVDQRAGLCAPCDWVVFGQSYWNNDSNKPISICSTSVNEAQKVVVPNGWVFEKSLSARMIFIENGKVPTNLKLITQENGVDVYQDSETGEKFYVGRVFQSTDEDF